MQERWPKTGTQLLSAVEAPRERGPEPLEPYAGSQGYEQQYHQHVQQQAQQAQQQYPPEQHYAQPQYAQQQYPPEPQYAQPQYAQPQYAQPQYAQPQYAQPQYAQPHQHAQAHALECPECGQMTTSLKQYNYLSYLLFVWFFAFWSVKRALACPSCMRKDLLIKLAYNTVLANLFWPILILPWNVVLICVSFTEGHSMGAEAMLRQGQTS